MKRRAETPIHSARPPRIGRAPTAGAGPSPSPAPGRRAGPPLRPLAAAALALAVAATGGCRSLPSGRKAAERSPEPAAQDPLGSALMGGNAPAQGRQSSQSGPNSPTEPEPMPELTADRAANVHLDLGRVFESRGQFEAAEAEYRRAVEADDRKLGRDLRALAHRRLAGALDRQGKFADSAAHHEAAMRLAPRDPRPWNDAGYSAYLRGDWDAAIELLGKAEKLKPDDPRVLTNLGLALAAAGREDEAAAVLARAGGPAAAEANLAYILAAAGRTDEARARYRQALSLNPENAVARRGISRLDADAARDAEAIASRPAPADPAVLPASFPQVEPPPIPGPSAPLPASAVAVDDGAEDAGAARSPKRPGGRRGLLRR